MIQHLVLGALLIVQQALCIWQQQRFPFLSLKNQSLYSIKQQRLWNLLWLDAIVIMMILASIIEAMIWAGCYVWLGAIEQFEEAVYFSIVTYTTLGYGDITLSTDWRFLASLEAASGIIFFGWTTAIVMAAFQNIYFPKELIMNKKRHTYQKIRTKLWIYFAVLR